MAQIDMIGKQFERLTVLSEQGTDDAFNKLYLCQCVCGNKKIAKGSYLRAKRIKSCGCKNVETRFGNLINNNHISHGYSNTRTYRTWASMKQRCSPTAKNKSKRLYYDKGIRVCERWMSFENFLADMGERPDGMTIDRIDSSKDYEPNNCRWATPKEQGNNTDFNHIVEFKGKRQTISQWANDLGIKPNTLWYRLNRTFVGKTL